MLYKRKIAEFVCAALSFAVFASGCTSKNTESSESSEEASSLSATDKPVSENKESTTLNIQIQDEPSSTFANLFSDRDLSGEYSGETTKVTLSEDKAQVRGNGAQADGSDILISEEGVYVFTGTLNDGQIIVNADSQAKIQIVLENADISCSDSSPVYVMNADKVFVTVPEDTESTLTDGTSYTYNDEIANEPDSAIFSGDSLTLNGGGTLNINANYNEAVTSKDDIVIAGCTLNIKSAANAIKGKDYVAISGASINIEAGGDGIKSTNIEEAGLGFVYVESGEISISAQEDGIQTDTEFIADGGNFTIISGGGSASAVPQMGNDFGGGFRRDEQIQSETTEDTTPSTKGIKGSQAVFIRGGSFNIDSAEDAIHSNSHALISDGTLNLASGDDGIHSDSQLDITGGTINITKSCEGIESAIINITGGALDLTSTDDGINAGNDTAQGGMGTYSDGVELNITGGTLCVNSSGDGLDSNGNMYISGGTVLVNGPTNNGNGALDGNGEMVCHGGTLVAAGSSGMAESPDNSSTQNVVSVTLDSTQEADTLVTICDESGNDIFSFAPAKTFNSIVISTPEIKSLHTYNVYIGGTSDSENFYGLYENGGYNCDGTEAGSFTSENVVSFVGSQGMGFGGGFGGGGKDFGGRGNRDEFEFPTDENGEIDMQIPEGGFGGRGDMQLPTDENGDIAMEIPTNANGQPDMPMHGGGFGGNFGDMQPPTNENGEIDMGMPPGGFGGGMMPYGQFQ